MRVCVLTNVKEKTVLLLIMIDSIQYKYAICSIVYKSIVCMCIWEIVCLVYRVFTVLVHVCVCICINVCARRDSYNPTDFRYDYEMCGSHSPFSFSVFFPVLLLFLFDFLFSQ